MSCDLRDDDFDESVYQRWSKEGEVGSTKLKRSERFWLCQTFAWQLSSTVGLTLPGPTMRATFAEKYFPIKPEAVPCTGDQRNQFESYLIYLYMGSFERKLRPERRAIASNRSETPAESLAGSLLLVLSKSSSRLEADVLREAFCRDVEAFSHVLLLDQNVRPQGCPKINSSLCAVLYDRLSFSSNTVWSCKVLPLKHG